MNATSPRVRAAIVLVATLAGVAVTARLGVWQLDRAAQKIAIRTEIDSRRLLAPLDGGALARTAAEAKSQFYRPARLRGRWLAEHTVFLDNRQMKGLPGFFVVTPLRLEGRAEAVVVQRGWVQRSFTDRTALPSVPTPGGIVEVDGLIAPPPSRLFEFDHETQGRIRQNLDLGAFARETQLPLLPLSLLQRDSATTAGDGLLRQWPLPTLDVSMHYGYAFQWFALAALMAGLYVWFQLIRPPGHRA